MPTTSYPRFPGDFRATLVCSLAEGLAKQGHEVHIVAPYDPLVAEDPHSPVHIHRVRYVSSDKLCLIGHGRSLEADTKVKNVVYPLAVLYVIAALWKVLRLNRQCGGFDVIHAHWVIPSGFVGAVAGWIANVPLVVHLHGSEVFVLQYSRWLGYVGRWVYSRADRLVSCSANLMQRTLELGLDPAKSEAIPTAVNAKRFSFNAESGRILRKRLGLPEEARVILAPGRLVCRKGFEYLIQAMPIILERHPQAWCIIAGDGDLGNALCTLAGEVGVRDRMIMLGPVLWNEMVDYYSAGDVLVVPSVVDHAGNVDGLPNVLLEGMACGLSVVATRVAGIPEVIRDGENGLLVEPKDAIALASAISGLLDSDEQRSRLAAAARAAVEQEFSIPKSVERLEEIYRSVQRPR